MALYIIPVQSWKQNHLRKKGLQSIENQLCLSQQMNRYILGRISSSRIVAFMLSNDLVLIHRGLS